MNPLNKHFLIGFSATAFLLGAQAAYAQDDPPPRGDEVRGSIAVGAAILPAYEGADEQQVIPLLVGELAWGERYLALEGTSLRANILNSRAVEFGPVANLTFGRDDKIDSPQVRALGVIDDAYEIGSFAAIKTGSLLTEGDELKLRVQALRDLSDVYDGWIGDATVSYQLPVGRRLTLMAAASASYADDNYAETYFGINATGAAASGLQAFTAEGGIKDVGVSLTASYALSDRWSVVGYGGFRRLLGDFADSPIVETAGSADQFSAGIGVGYRF